MSATRLGLTGATTTPPRRISSQRDASEGSVNATGAPTTPGPDEAPSTDDITLHTPAQAAELLSIKESWLRRKAGQRSIPCTFLGKHLRFSTRDLRAITALGAQPVLSRRTGSRRPRGTG